jgi:16S rRNA (guanine(966)-N(2))-methyltransferase RsmD
MRIISGTHGGRRINPPAGLPVRPTTDQAKEALFNILANSIDFEETAVLDIFAGTGSMSFEFASRGCQHIVSVDIHRKCTEFIKKTCLDLKITSIKPMNAESFRYIIHCKQKFGLIFADPPYDLPSISKIPDTIFEHKLLKENGLLILEHSANLNFTSHPSFQKEKKYGKVHFTFFSY